MPQTQVNCQQCRQPIIAEVQRLFDVGENPQDKQKFLAGAFNIARCPHCGFQGMLAMPLVYHDPTKELLLTYFPPEIGLSMDEQQKTIGPVINRIVDKLPQEKRKGYLLNPKTMLTFQLMIETVLEADGITKDMLKAQEERMNLIQRLMTASEETRIEMIKKEDEMIDREFFVLLSRLLEAVIAGSDENSASQLTELQDFLLERSSQGKKILAETQEVQMAIEDLQKLGDGVTREKILDLVSTAQSDTQLRTYARMARPAMDYTFFQMLSERIDRARSKGRSRLIEIREKLLEFTQEVDQEIAERSKYARKNVEALLQVEDIKSALQENVDAIDEFFIQAVTESLDRARKEGDIDHSSRLQQILDVINELLAPPEEFRLIEELLEISDDEGALKTAVESRGEDITPDLIQMINAILMQTHESIEKVKGKEKTERQEVLSRLQAVHDAVLGFSMKRSFKSG